MDAARQICNDHANIAVGSIYQPCKGYSVNICKYIQVNLGKVWLKKLTLKLAFS